MLFDCHVRETGSVKNLNSDELILLVQKGLNRFLTSAGLVMWAAFFMSTTSIYAATTSYDLFDARERGTASEGEAKGTVTATYDDTAKNDVLEFDYLISENALARVWLKNFPSELNPAAAGTAKIGVRVATQEEAGKISVTALLRGAKGEQNIPFHLRAGWSYRQEAIQWELIGDLKEVSFVVAPVAGVSPVKGTLFLSLDFIPPVMAPKPATITPVSPPLPKPVSAPAVPAKKIVTPPAVTVKKSVITPVVSGLAPDEKKLVSIPAAVQVPKAPARVSFGLLDVGEKGITTDGIAKGSITVSFDDEARKDIYDLSYTLSRGSSLRVWTRKFPSDVAVTQTNTIELGFRMSQPSQLRQVAVQAEIVGTRHTQTIPIRLKPGWNSISKMVRWDWVGELMEVNFVLIPKGKAESVSGTLCLGFDFYKISFFQKNLFLIKFGSILFLSFLASLLGSVLGKIFRRRQVKISRLSREKTPGIFHQIMQDFFYGGIIVLITGAAIWIYGLGMTGPLAGGFSFLAAGLVGALIAECLKLKMSGKHLTPAEIFQNVLVTALLALSSSRLELLQAPTAWSHLLMLNKFTAVVAFLLYQIFNANALASSGKHLSPVAGAFIVGTPYLVGWLLLLENVTLLQTLAYSVTFGLLVTWPQILEGLGRFLVVMVFNELLANGFSYLIKGRLLKTPKTHITLMLVSLAVVVAPSIANLGSSTMVAAWPAVWRALAAIATTVLSFAGLWGEIYFLTGILLDGGKRIAPSEENIIKNILTGMKKGMAYSGILMALLYIFAFLFTTPATQNIMAAFPYVTGIFFGALLFPLAKTLIETFDGSLPFFERLRYSYGHWTLYLRGAIVGFGFAFMIAHNMFEKEMSERVWFGLWVGLAASGGVSFLRDLVYAVKGQGKIQSWRLYLVDSLLGIFLGSALTFYLDAPQVSVVLYKFNLYITTHFSSAVYTAYPYLNSLGHYVQPVLISKWGLMDLGYCPGGVKLLFTESLDGVIKWSVATWLFAFNKVFLQAFFDKDATPIKTFFSKAGVAQLSELMIYVLRWGLWMSPIIYTFLRMTPDPTWYNQDGAIRTVFAIFNQATMTPAAFQEWSVKIFVLILGYDLFRILIWMDHMGLRVATLVNLSFLGMDKLDEKIARFIGPAAAQRYIPEGVKRFTTWAPLLIPFYLPRGESWDYVWSTSEAIQNAQRHKGIIPFLQSLDKPQLLLLILGSVLLATGICFLYRILHRRSMARRIKSYELSNREYKVTLKENGEIFSEALAKECDISRRSYEIMDPCGRTLYIVDMDEKPGSVGRAWPVIGNFPSELYDSCQVRRVEDGFEVTSVSHGIRTVIEIRLPDQDSAAEIWKINMENISNKPRRLKIVSYLEWVLNGGIHDRFHTQYQRLYPEMEYVSQANAMIAWQKATKCMGFVSSDAAPEGFLTGRVDFIGRGRSLWSPRILETMDFLEAKDTPACPTFDPIASLLIGASMNAGETKTIRMLVGFAKKKDKALEMIQKLLRPVSSRMMPLPGKKRSLLIGHGEIPPGTPQPYFEYQEQGNKLLVRTPYTPRPFDHAMSNPIHSMMVTNRGLHTSANGNSQQNRLTPDWSDTVTREIPAEAIYLYDTERKEWFSPTPHPLNDAQAHHEAEFGVDGTAIFRMTKGTLATELTVFVPTQDPMGVYLLTVKNQENRPRKLRVAPYFQIALAFMPERSGPLGIRHDKVLDALFYENPRNIFRSGPAFASMSIPADKVETSRGRFFGKGRSAAHPFMVEHGKPDQEHLTDPMQIAGFLGTLEIPARGEQTIAIILGQTDHRKEAIQLVQKYKNIETVFKSLQETRQWWLDLMSTAEIRTNDMNFDYYQNWLKYQALAERIWARRGFYQTSGAYGFRDQLQDTVNLMWVDPALARKQILLHASQQFIEGDVFHWFFTLTDGRSAFSCRSHASDNLLWLAWGVVEYIRVTGDETILNEMTTYVASEFPFAPLPKNKQGWGSLYQRSTRADTVYRHCMRSIDVVLEKRTGRNGLPLMGTGDWNDGLDEIGSEGKGESVWLGFFLYYILKEMVQIIEKKDGLERKGYYLGKMHALEAALERTWRGDRYLRAIHDDGTEIGVKDSGVWEIDALTAAWAVYSGINFERSLTIFNTALKVLERGNVILLGWPALREDTKPYLGRSSKYPEGVRENGMYCHGVQWLVRAARLLAEALEKQGDRIKADEYRATAYRLWQKITPIAHVMPQEIEIYGGQPNKQPADFLTTFEPGRMIWNGYTGAAGWMLRQAFEGVVGAVVVKNKLVLPSDLDQPRGSLRVSRVHRDISRSPLK